MGRYLWAGVEISKALGRASERRSVFDYGSGTGYGAYALSMVLGPLYDLYMWDPLLSFACRRWLGRDEVDDVGPPPYMVQAVTCIEVIEHMGRALQTVVAGGLAGMMDTGGVLCLTTPERQHPVSPNPHHKHELSEPELRALVEGSGFQVESIERVPYVSTAGAETVELRLVARKV